MNKDLLKSKILLVLVMAVFSRSLLGQSLPTVTPPSPSTQQFMKYVDYPVGSCTGVPEINIPLYTIKSGDLTVPISISYHSSGVKPSDPNGFVGLGWSINAGGKISRTVVGQVDEVPTALPSPFYTTNQ